MSASAEKLALAQSYALYDDLMTAVDERTLDIVERRRKTATIRRRGWMIRRALVIADAFGLLLAFLAAQWLFAESASFDEVAPHKEWALFVLTLPGWIVVAKLYGLYDRDEERTDHSTVDEIVGVFHLVTVGAWLFFAGTWITDTATPYMPKLATFWLLAFLLVCTARASARALCRRSVTYLQNTIVVGGGDVAQSIARKILTHPEYGINLVGLVATGTTKLHGDLAHLALLGASDRLPALIRLLDVERVVVVSSDANDETVEIVRELNDVRVDIVPRLFDLIGPGVGLHTIEGITLLGIPPMQISRSSLAIKRTMDVVGSAAALVLLAPVLLAIALLIRLDSRGPVFYRHERIGKHGRPFKLFKFRTMRLAHCRGPEYGGAAAEASFLRLMEDEELRSEFDRTQKLRADPRVTRVGRVLRSWSLDELPQLINALRGEISLVGPRPVTAAEAWRYGDRWRNVLSIRPGVTGYWQINGRSALEYEDRVRLDLAYVSNWSLALDLTILAKTLRVLVARRGAV